eukprot:s1787_g10.t1
MKAVTIRTLRRKVSCKTPPSKEASEEDKKSVPCSHAMARGLKKPPKRRRLGRPSRTATAQEQNAGLASKDPPTVDAATGSWAAEAVAHARILLGERPPEHGVPEAAAMLSAVLLRLPDLWSELAQDALLAFGTTSTANDVSGSARSRSGGSAFVAGREDLAARSRRLLLSAVASAVCPVRSKAGNSRPLAAAATSVTLQCLLGEAEADEGKFIAAFQSLRRAEALAKQAGDVTGASRAEAALDGLRAAALQRWHFQMINDVPRGEQYGRAIALAVAQLAERPEVRARGGVTALDIGTGTGLLALMCAQQQGVQKVHACEMNEALCAIAKEVIASQTTSHCPITLHPNVSTALSMEDRVDLVFCEVFDAGLLGEHALPTILHARQALLREGGLLIPACAQLFGQLVEAPKLLERFAVLHSPTGASLKGARLRNSERYSCETMSTIPHVKLTDPIPLVKLDFQEIEYLYSNLGNWIDPPVELRATCAGIAQFLVYWWEIVLDTEGYCRINTAPEGGCESWEQAVRPLAGWDSDECLRVTDGELLHLHLRMQADGIDVLLQDAKNSEDPVADIRIQCPPYVGIDTAILEAGQGIDGVSFACSMAPVWWRNLGTQFDISSIYAVSRGARFPPDEATVKGKDLLLKTDVGAAHILDANVGLGINYAVMAWHWAMVLVFMVIYFGIAALTTPMHEGIPWLTLVQKLLVFWNMWEALGLGVLSGPMHAEVNPPFQDWWYRWTVGTMKYNAPFLPCLPNRRNYLDVLVEGVLMYMLTIRVLVSPEVTPALMWPLTACLIYEFLFDYGQHMHTYGTQTMYCFFCMCFTVEQGQVAGLQLFMTWFYLCSGWCKIGPWFKYLNVSNLWSAKYMVSMPWSDWYRRVMYKGYKDSDPDYHLTRAATLFSAACAVSETLGPMLVLSNSDSVVTFSIIFICCMHLYIISTLIVDVFTWNFVDALLYIFLFGCYGPAVGGPMGLQWHDVPKIHPAMAAFLLAHALYSVYGNFVPSHVPYVVAHRHAAGNFAQGVLLVRVSAAAKLGKVVAHSGCPVVKGAPAPGWIGEWLGFHLLMAYLWFWNLPNRMLLPLTFDQLQAFGGREEDFIMLHSVLVFDALAAHVRFDGLSNLALEGECTLCWVGGFQSFPVQLFSDPSAMWKVVDSKKGVVREGTYTVQDVEDPAYKKPSDCRDLKIAKKLSMSRSLVPDDDLVELQLEEEELMRFNDTDHWQAVKEAMARALASLAPGSFVQLLDISDALPLSLLLAPELCAAASRWDAVCCLRSRAEKQALLSLLASSSLDADRVHILLASAQQLIQAALPSPFPPNGAGAEAKLQSTPSASLVICEDIVGASGALRAEALEDLALLWRTCSGRHGRELRVVPEAIVMKLSLIDSDELERRTRVVERPGGVDVSEVNALSVSDFLSLEEALLKPRYLCKEVEALSLPLGPSLLTALAALSARENGAPLLRLRLTAESPGKVHGIVTRFAWPGSAGHCWDKRLAGVLWPCEGRNRPPHLEVGDCVVVTVGYTPARGLVVTPVCLERTSGTNKNDSG